jgi:ABC-2 type transport system ATP-binding protein
MDTFQHQFEQLTDFLKYDDYTILTKRLIDLTLDTESVVYYQQMNDLLDWLDDNTANSSIKKLKYQVLLDELYVVLSKKVSVVSGVLVLPYWYLLLE